MSTRNKTLGELIEYEVRRQGLSITAFADSICCQRNNVYDIFKRGDKIDAAQLKLISKVLERNFFADIAQDDDLINLDDPEVKKDMENRRAVSQFMETMPDILIKIGIDPSIVFSKLSKVWGEELPDFMITNTPICFTIGDRLIDKIDGDIRSQLKVETYKTPEGTIIDAWVNYQARTVLLDIAIIYRSKEEWESAIRYAFETIIPKYGPLCFVNSPRIEREIKFRELYGNELADLYRPGYFTEDKIDRNKQSL